MTQTVGCHVATTGKQALASITAGTTGCCDARTRGIFSQALGDCTVLYQKHIRLARRRAANRLYFTGTIGAEQIETYRIVLGIQMALQPLAQLQILFVGQVTFKEAILGPVPKAAEYFMYFGPSFVRRDIIGD